MAINVVYYISYYHNLRSFCCYEISIFGHWSFTYLYVCRSEAGEDGIKIKKPQIFQLYDMQKIFSLVQQWLASHTFFTQWLILFYANCYVFTCIINVIFNLGPALRATYSDQSVSPPVCQSTHMSVRDCLSRAYLLFFWPSLAATWPSECLGE